MKLNSYCTEAYTIITIISMTIVIIIWQGRMILAHLCDEPKGLKTGMCMVLSLLNSYCEIFLFCAWFAIGLRMLTKSIIYTSLLCSSPLLLPMHWLQNWMRGMFFCLFFFYCEIVISIVIAWWYLTVNLTLFCASFRCSVPLVDESLVLLLYCAYTGKAVTHTTWPGNII